MAHSGLPNETAAQYFTECQEAILADAVTSIRNDTKILTFQSFPHILCVGQLVVWDAAKVLQQQLSTIELELSAVKPDWFMNLVSVNEGCSYFICKNPEVKIWLAGLLGVNFHGDIAKADRLWLRKEIMKADLES